MTPKFDRSVSLICWAFNEEDSILEFLERATRLLSATVEDYEIVLIDDCSTDRTNAIAAEFQKRDPRLKLHRNERNLNVGISCRRAIQLARKEYLFWQTIDWCYDISDLRGHLELLKSYDIVQGVRRRPVEVKLHFLKPLVAAFRLFGVKHLTRRSDTVWKAIVSVINYAMIRVLFRVPISDYQNVTFYPTRWIQSVHYEATSSFMNPEGLIKSYWHGMSIREVPISFIPREKGTAKGATARTISRSVKDITKIWFQYVILGRRGQVQSGRVIRVVPADQPEESSAVQS